jgi:hypothetical protein
MKCESKTGIRTSKIILGKIPLQMAGACKTEANICEGAKQAGGEGRATLALSARVGDSLYGPASGDLK